MSLIDTMKNRKKIWIISEGSASDYSPESMGDETVSGPFKEYKLSELGWYLINPHPIVIKDRLIGCNITLKKSKPRKYRDKIKGLFVKESETTGPDDDMTREFISSSHVKSYTFRDQHLENHFKNIYDALRPYDSLLRMLFQLDVNRVHDITGICEDIVGNRYQLDLQGSVSDKLNYMTTSLLTDVNITMKKAYLSRGLFELRGFNFRNYDPKNSYKLVRFFKDGKTTYCVLGKNKDSRFLVPETKLITFLQLFQQSLETNTKLYEAVEHCLRGDAKPFKLFFTKQLEFSYSKTHLPRIFRENANITQLPPEERTVIADTLNSQQRVISFNYVPHSEGGSEKMHTNISVMHSLKALEPLKSRFPTLFSQIKENAPISDAGKFYLLDSMRGCQDE